MYTNYSDYRVYPTTSSSNYGGYQTQSFGRSSDSRLIGGGFLFPFVLGGITGGLLSPAFRPNYYPYYRPYPYYSPYPYPYYPYYR